MTPDLYAILQVRPDADVDVIGAAYRALARRIHPDRGGSTQAMARLNEAWAVLRDPASRAAYDRSRRPDAAPRREPVVAADGPIATRRAASGDSTVLDFGRYAGCSLDQIARCDPAFLEWLRRTPVGRRYRDEIDALIGSPSAA